LLFTGQAKQAEGLKSNFQAADGLFAAGTGGAPSNQAGGGSYDDTHGKK